MGAAMVVGGRVPALDSHPMKPINVASPADSFVIHDAPAAAPVPAPAAPAPAPATPDPAAPSGLEAAIEKLRAAKTDDPAPPPDTPPPATVTADPLLAGPNPAPSALAGPPVAPPPLPPPAWSVVTSQGVRWRSAPNALVIDMGGGRTATVFVDPAFQALPLEAASARVDFLKQTILETFPRGASQFRFARDGSVSMLR